MKRFVTTAILLAGLMAGCFGPSVPVPPPGPESMTFMLDAEGGTATYEAGLGSDWANAWVTLYDDTTGEGTVSRSNATGHVGPTQPFRANEGDTVRIEFRRDDGPEAGVCLILHNGPSSSNYECTN